MKNPIALVALVVLIALYLSFYFAEGVLYSTSLDVLHWLNTEHGKSKYLGVLLLISCIISYLFMLEKSDKRKMDKTTDELIKNIKATGIHAAKTENTGFGEVYLEAAITFEDSGFILQVTQKSTTEKTVLLTEKKFLSWGDLLKYIDSESEFSLLDFLPKISPEFQLPQEDAHAK